MPVLEANYRQDVGAAQLEVAIRRSRLQLQVLQKIQVFQKKFAAGGIDGVITKTVSAQCINGTTLTDGRTQHGIGSAGDRDISVLSDDVAITDAGEPCVWRRNMYGTGWCVIPPQYIEVMSLRELELFMQVKT